MVFNLAALHDMNTGVILTALVIAYLKSRSSKNAYMGLLALIVFILSILPTPLHGTGVWGIAALLTAYAYLYKIRDDKEVTILVSAAIILMMLNILLGFKLRGIF